MNIEPSVDLGKEVNQIRTQPKKSPGDRWGKGWGQRKNGIHPHNLRDSCTLDKSEP